MHECEKGIRSWQDRSKEVCAAPQAVVDQSVLRELQAGYDTNGILQTVDSVDACRVCLCDPDGIRGDLLRLHAMAQDSRLQPMKRRFGKWPMN